MRSSPFEKLPIELILSILNGMCISDILSISRVSRQFRGICTSYRELWNHSADIHLLSLPPGQTIQTIDISGLLPLCARAVSLSKKWKQEHIEPKRVLDLTAIVGNLFQFPKCDMVPHILPGGRYVVVRGDWEVVLVSVDGKFTKKLEEFAPRNGQLVYIKDLVYDVEEDGSICMAVLIPRFIHLYHITDYDTPKIKIKKSKITIGEHYEYVDLSSSIMLLGCESKIMIYDLSTHRKVKLRHPSHSVIKCECFHPRLPYIFLTLDESPLVPADQRTGSSLNVLSISKALSLINPSDDSDQAEIYPLSSACYRIVQLDAQTNDEKYWIQQPRCVVGGIQYEVICDTYNFRTTVHSAFIPDQLLEDIIERSAPTLKEAITTTEVRAPNLDPYPYMTVNSACYPGFGLFSCATIEPNVAVDEVDHNTPSYYTRLAIRYSTIIGDDGILKPKLALTLPFLTEMSQGEINGIIWSPRWFTFDEKTGSLFFVKGRGGWDGRILQAYFAQY